MANNYEVPSWAGKPPVGLHLDVLKVDKLVQKLMIDEKRCYLFGRNPQMNDFVIDHASCSRVHAAFVYHKHLNRAFLVDLGSTHGTYIGNMRIESQKPTQLPIDSVFHFGASTRRYILRERPQTGTRPIMEELEKNSEDVEGEGGLLGLPETETELDNLTEFNTAHNRRISMLGIQETEISRSGAAKRRKKGVSFNEDEEVINPEDVDPSVGRFRNLVHTTVIPTKRLRTGMEGPPSHGKDDRLNFMKQLTPASIMPHLYRDIPPESNACPGPGQAPHITHPSHVNHGPSTLLFSSAMASRLGLTLPNPAPDVELGQEAHDDDLSNPVGPGAQGPTASGAQAPEGAPGQEPKKKKYAKEAWPGKKPVPTLLV